MYCCRYKNILFTAAIILSATALKAQPDYFATLFRHTRDSLVTELKKYPVADTARAHALFRIVDCSLFLKEKKEVMPYWEEGMQISRRLNYTLGIVGSLTWKANYYKSAKNIDSAISLLDSAILIAGNPDNVKLKRAKAYAFFAKGTIYENQENLYTALKNYFEALKNYDSTEVVNQKKIFIKIAGIYQQLNNDEKALGYYNSALELINKEKERNSLQNKSQTYLSIAAIYFKKNNISQATYYLDKLEPLMPDTVETIITGGYYRLSGQIALKELKKDSALQYFKNALQYYSYSSQMHADIIVDVCTDIAYLKMDAGDFAEAKNYVDKSMAAATESNHKAALANAFLCEAAYYNKTGNQSGAYADMQKAIILNDSVLTEANIKQANTLAAIYENDKKENAIAQLQADKKIQAATVKQKSLLNTVFIVVIAALLIMGILLYLNFKHKQKLTTQEQLIQQQKITELEKEKQLMGIEGMLKGQEEERSRLAKDLHDGLGGMLSGVKISFSNMKENLILDADNAASFEKSITQLDSSIAELRKVAHNLMPEALVKFGLKNAVKDFCESMQLSGNTKIICEQFDPERELGNTADVNVYRIIQELVNNAVTHGAATQIVVQLTKIPGKVLITVEDNGKGFDLTAQQKSPGIGLSNIKHRVNYFNGEMDIDTKPGEGTTVNIELTA